MIKNSYFVWRVCFAMDYDTAYYTVYKYTLNWTTHVNVFRTGTYMVTLIAKKLPQTTDFHLFNYNVMAQCHHGTDT